MNEKLLEMLEMQAELDRAIFEKHGGGYQKLLNSNAYFYAIFDELGEWNHTRKSEWCWWKESQKPTDRKKELEEFADALHFCLSHDLALFNGDVEKTMKKIGRSSDQGGGISQIGWLILSARYQPWTEPEFTLMTRRIFDLARQMRYTPEEIYEAYKEKNRINFERLESNY